MSENDSKRPNASFWLALLFAVIIAVWLVTARQFDRDTRLFPWAVGIPAFLLVLRQLVNDWRGARAATEAPAGGPPQGILDLQADASIPPAVLRRHTWKELGWIGAFALGIWLLGFLIAIPVFIFLYLVYEARSSTAGALFIAAVTVSLVWVMFDYVMHIAWPQAALRELLGF
jgi:hypothetical protein